MVYISFVLGVNVGALEKLNNSLYVLCMFFVPFFMKLCKKLNRSIALGNQSFSYNRFP